MCFFCKGNESRLPAPSILPPLAELPKPPGSAAAWGRLWGAVSSADPHTPNPATQPRLQPWGSAPALHPSRMLLAPGLSPSLGRRESRA